MARGLLLNIETQARLTARQMMSIAHSRYSGKDPVRPGVGKEFALAIEWAEGAEEVITDPPGSFAFNYMKEFLNRARIVHDRNWKTPSGQRGVLPNEEVFVEKILHEDRTIKSGKYLRQKEMNFLESEPQVRDLSSGFNIHDFYSLCRTERLENLTKTLKNPYCYFQNKDPYFVLAPLKMEIVSEDPPIYIYHQILTEGEIEFMTTGVMAQLKVNLLYVSDMMSLDLTPIVRISFILVFIF